MSLALEVINLSKEYRIGAKQESYYTLRDTLVDVVAAPFRRVRNLVRGSAYGAAELTEPLWALRDVSFTVEQGDVIGIIGRNGAGKSTLLKILSQITEPTSGQVRLYGRVGALLEVGTGFHQELTGRENIYLNGAILGMSRKEIDRKFDEIVDFAGVEKFIDTPVKHYSSGMGLRLGFAVAAHLEPDILIVDEVLAVGDAEFQKKCMGKMSDVASEGRTVLFVSHNLSAVQSLCKYAIWLQAGQVVNEGLVKDVAKNYLSSSMTLSKSHLYEDKSTALGNDRIRIRSISVTPDNDNPYELITMITPLKLTFEYWNLRPSSYLNLSLLVYNSEGILAFNSAPVHDEQWLLNPYPEGLFRTECFIPPYLLNSDTYNITMLFVENQSQVIYRLENALAFEVLEAPEVKGVSSWMGKWSGIVHPKLEWQTHQVLYK